MRLAASSAAERTVAVGGAAMYPSRNIVENAVDSRDHATLVAAVEAAGLVDTLSEPGPFTADGTPLTAWMRARPGGRAAARAEWAKRTCSGPTA